MICSGVLLRGVTLRVSTYLPASNVLLLISVIFADIGCSVVERRSAIGLLCVNEATQMFMDLEKGKDGSFKKEWITFDADPDFYRGSAQKRTHAYTFQGKGYWVQEVVEVVDGYPRQDGKIIVYWHDAVKADLKKVAEFGTGVDGLHDKLSVFAIPAMYLKHCWDLLVTQD